MEVPSPASGKVVSVKVKEGDTVSQGSLVVVLQSGAVSAPVPAPHPGGVQEPESASPSAAPTPAGEKTGGVLRRFAHSRESWASISARSRVPDARAASFARM